MVLLLYNIHKNKYMELVHNVEAITPITAQSLHSLLFDCNWLLSRLSLLHSSVTHCSFTFTFWAQCIFCLTNSSVKSLHPSTSCHSRQQQASPPASEEAGRREKAPFSGDTKAQQAWLCSQHRCSCGGALPEWREHCVPNMALGGSWQRYVSF